MLLGPLEATLELSGPSWASWLSFAQIFWFWDHYETTWIWIYLFQNHILFHNYPGPKWFCIQNLYIDLSFQEKKTLWKSDTWLPRYLQNKHCTIFLNTLYHAKASLLELAGCIHWQWQSCSNHTKSKQRDGRVRTSGLREIVW